MNATARKRCAGNDSFIVCFYCNETFRSLSSLLKHCCSAEQKTFVDLEPFEIISDNTNDLDQEDSVVSTETFSENPSDTLGQEITESSASNYGVTSFSGTEIGCEKGFLEIKSNVATQEITQTASDSSEKRLSEPNSDVISEVTEQATDASEKQLSEASSDTSEVTEQATEGSKKQFPDTGQKITEVNINADEEFNRISPDLVTTTDASEKQLSKTISDLREVTEQATEASKKRFPETGQKITEVDINADEFNRASPDLVSKVLLYYEKQTKPGTPDSCCKSPSTEVEFQSSHLPLPIVESGLPRHDDTQIECSASVNSNKGLSSETKCETYGENMIQKESDALKQNAEGLECQASNICSKPSPKIDSDSSNMFSRSSSVEMDLDSVGCGDDQADSEDSDVSDTLLLPDKKTELIKHESSVESLPEVNLNITKQYSKIVKPCYVKLQDIFKSLVDAKVSPRKIFSWKKKYHVCDVCNKFFRLRSDLNIHYLIHTTVKPFVCNICDKSFVKQANLFAHHIAHTIKRHHACPICKRTFPKKSLLLRHKLVHTKEKPYACDKCDKSYSAKSSLNEHYLSHSDERPFVCEICSATFANKRYLRKHYYSHKKKENVCTLCFKTFKLKHHLEEHYNIHTNDRPHVCKICSKSFHLLLTLNYHYSLAHKSERALIFPHSAKTYADCKIGKNPVIQKIEISTEVDNSEKTRVVQKPAVVHITKETLSYSTRRKSFIPKKYLQPD